MHKEITDVMSTHYVIIPMDLKTILQTRIRSRQLQLYWNDTLGLFQFCNQYLSFFVVVVVFSRTDGTSVRGMPVLSTTKKLFCYAISSVGLKMMIRHSLFFLRGRDKTFRDIGRACLLAERT